MKKPNQLPEYVFNEDFEMEAVTLEDLIQDKDLDSELNANIQQFIYSKSSDS